MERCDVLDVRATFLQEIQRHGQTHVFIIYLDGTWVNQNYPVPMCWVDTPTEKATGVKAPSGRGSRLILLHVGIKRGFDSNAELVF